MLGFSHSKIDLIDSLITAISELFTEANPAYVASSFTMILWSHTVQIITDNEKAMLIGYREYVKNQVIGITN